MIFIVTVFDTYSDFLRNLKVINGIRFVFITINIFLESTITYFSVTVILVS